MTTIPNDVNWIDDVCGMNLVAVSQQSNKLYAVGGYSILRSPTNSSGPGTALANSHVYALDFSSPVDLQKNYTSIFTSITRLPDLVPRIIWGNFFWRDSSLNLFGGSQTTFPIFLANGSYNLADRVNISDGLWNYDISKSNWTWNHPYGGTQGKPIGQAAKAFDGSGDGNRGVFWFYGGGYWEEPVSVGSELKGNKVDMVEYTDLWRMPGDCNTSMGFVTACKQVTITSSSSTVARPTLQATMVWVDNTRSGTSAKGLLVLFGGHISGNVVSMRNVHVYDVATATWYTQPTTAENDLFPPDRTEACAVVGRAADGSSYNIYVHGGVSNGTVVGGLWILTLPTFQWIHSDIGTENTRAGHTCSKVQEKFMVIYRGVPNLGDAKCDDYAGIKIVDLDTLQWVTKMDVGPNMAYKVPDLVKKVIGGSATGGAIYTSPRNGFIDTKLYDVFNVTTANPLGTTSPSNTSKKLPSTTLIGAILGGLVFLIIILALILWLLKRHRNLKKQVAQPVELPPVPATGNRAEMAAREAPAVELPGNTYGGHEMVMGSQHEEVNKAVPIRKVGEVIGVNEAETEYCAPDGRNTERGIRD